MAQHRRIQKQRNVFSTLLLSTLLPCLIATILLAIVFIPMMHHTAANNDESHAQTVLYASAVEFEILSDTVDEMVSTVEHSDWIHSLYLDMLNDKHPSATDQKSIIFDLNQACIRGNAKSLSFQFFDDKVLYNNRCVIKNQEFYQISYPTQVAYQFYPTEEQTSGYSTLTFDGVEYLLYKTPFRDVDGGRYKGDINILFHSSQIGEKLANAAGPDATAFRITDLNGNILWQYKTGIYDEAVVTLSQTLETGNLYFSVDIPQHIYAGTAKTATATVIGILLSGLVISAALSYYLTRLSYRPIQQFVWKYVGTMQQPDNDLLALEHVFDRILQEKSEIETTLNQLRPIAQQKILASLLDGTARFSDVLDEQLENCRISFQHERFNVIALTAPFSQLDAENVEFTAELAMETLLTHLGNKHSVLAYLYCEDSDHYRILVNYQTWDDLHGYLSQMFNNCQTYFGRQTAGEGLYLGVGQAVFSAEEIYRADEQAVNALHIAALNKLEQPMFYSEVAQEISFDYFYPMSEELLLSRAITNCNTETAMMLLNSIIDENLSRTKLDPKCIGLLYMDLASTVSRSGQSLGISLAPINIPEAVIELEDIRRRVADMINKLCTEIVARRQKNTNNTEKQIFAFIDEHIFDPDLSLSGIAQHFNKSPAYISTIFKEQRGTNYNSYVNQTRIMRAVQLLSEEKMDVNTVYPMVGYVSISTFRRNFVKYAKTNPGEVNREG